MARAQTTTPVAGAVREVQPRDLIVSIFGLYARAEHSWLSVASLIRLMSELGVDGPAVRSSVSRLKRRDTLRSMHLDGAAGYVLSPSLMNVLREGDARIFDRRRATLDDGWLLLVFSVPETERDKRHELRTWLTRLGFGMAAPGVWIAPGNLVNETREVLTRRGLHTYVDIFGGRHLAFDGLASKVRQWWDLDELAAQYADFLRASRPLARRLARKKISDRDAFAEYVPLLTAWRRLPYLDPGLPVEYLPRSWNGIVAADLFASLHALLDPPARRHAQLVMDS